MTRLDSRGGLAVILAIAIAVLIFIEWHTDEPLVVLPVLLIACLTGGVLAPRFWIASGLMLGWAILAAHAASEATGLFIPQYEHQPPARGDWIAMSLLVLPGVCSAFAGSRVWKYFPASVT